MVSGCTFKNLSSTNINHGIVVSDAPTNWSEANQLFSIPVALQSGAVLTNTGVISSNEHTTILVHPAGQLVVDGGTFENASTGAMWQGITVMGDSSRSLPSYLNNVFITNGGAIKNAITGITIYGGGRVATTGALFENNKTGVHFKPLVTTQIGNSGLFTQTNFTLDNNYLGNPADFGAHLRMDSCGHVSIEDCGFSSTVPLNPNNGIVVSKASTTWASANQLYVPVALYNEATLTLTGTACCSMNTKINVYGGNLTIAGGTLFCRVGQWQGITTQGSVQKPSVPGIVNLQNGGTIRDAILGIHALTGGNVTATDAYFINNKVGVQMEPSSQASFANTHFTINYNYPGNSSDFDAHLKLFNLRLTTVSGCAFLNETFHVNNPNDPIKNIGIQTFNSNLSCSNHSTFSGFRTAISASNSGTSPSVSITGSAFSNNLRGVGLNAVNYSEVKDNQFDMTDIGNAIGLYSNQTTGYSFVKNSFFTDAQAQTNTTGIMINESGVEPNVVFSNTFYYTNVGIQAIGQNSDQDSITPPGKGLQFICNRFFEGQGTDILVGSAPWQSYSGDHSVNWCQGYPQNPAGNAFYRQSISNYSNYDIHYHYSTLIPNEYPSGCVGSVNPQGVNLSSDCSSPFKRAGIDLEQVLAQYDEWNAEYEYWLAQLHTVISAGNEMDSIILTHVSYYSALKDNYFNTIIVAIMKEKGEGKKEQGEKNDELLETLRFLFSYRNHYTDNLSIIETLVAENNYNEAFATIARIYRQYQYLVPNFRYLFC